MIIREFIIELVNVLIFVDQFDQDSDYGTRDARSGQRNENTHYLPTSLLNCCPA